MSFRLFHALFFARSLSLSSHTHRQPFLLILVLDVLLKNEYHEHVDNIPLVLLFYFFLLCFVNNEHCLRLSNRFFVLNLQPQIVLLPCKLQASNIPFFLLQMHRCLLCMAHFFLFRLVCFRCPWLIIILVYL